MKNLPLSENIKLLLIGSIKTKNKGDEQRQRKPVKHNLKLFNRKHKFLLEISFIYPQATPLLHLTIKLMWQKSGIFKHIKPVNLRKFARPSMKFTKFIQGLLGREFYENYENCKILQ